MVLNMVRLIVASQDLILQKTPYTEHYIIYIAKSFKIPALGKSMPYYKGIEGLVCPL